MVQFKVNKIGNLVKKIVDHRLQTIDHLFKQVVRGLWSVVNPLMIQLKFPYHPFKIKEEEGKEVIFDEVRKKWVRLTPEEWVRQNMIQYLVHVKSVPLKWIGVEKEIKLGELSKRFDIIVVNASMQTHLLIECKAADVVLNEEVLHQVLRYNISLPAPFLVVTNGNETFVFEKKNGELVEASEFPGL